MVADVLQHTLTHYTPIYSCCLR